MALSLDEVSGLLSFGEGDEAERARKHGKVSRSCHATRKALLGLWAAQALASRPKRLPGVPKQTCAGMSWARGSPLPVRPSRQGWDWPVHDWLDVAPLACLPSCLPRPAVRPRAASPLLPHHCCCD